MKRKILLMGKSGSGKTSMRSIIFSNYIAKDTRRLGATIDVEHSQVRFLGDLVLNLWDCGGQQAFMDNYLSTQREHVFRNVAIFIYVLDVLSTEPDKELSYFKNCLEAIASHSKDALVYALVHKMDLVNDQISKQVYSDRVAELEKRALPLQLTCFGTSIWNESLYRAWSAMVYALIPNVQTLQDHLTEFARINAALEVVLFEKTTFLVVARSVLGHDEVKDEPLSASAEILAERNGALDLDRFEKISNIVKQFKLSCGKIGNQLSCIEIVQSDFSILLDSMTLNTYVMIVVVDPRIQLAALKLNLATARPIFEKIEMQAR